MFSKFDIIVVGAGHAGCEAALSSARMGKKTLLITQNLSSIAALSCNPSMGGVAKGQIVREIDALGGFSGICTDMNTLQFRMLNASKGAAMHSPRAQVDDITFPLFWRNKLENTQNLYLWQDEVIGLKSYKGKIIGVKTLTGEINARAIILTNGTFLKGRIHIGKTSYSGGRLGEEAANLLSDDLRHKGFITERLKTGTCVRVDGRSIDFTKLIEQKGDDNPSQFSYYVRRKEPLIQHSCYIAATNEEVHDILRKGFKDSPLFQGRIQGKGPRYCPSIEDKIERFADKDHHQLFIEPESEHTSLWYVNGFSSSLPLDIQYEALKHIKGFENAVICRSGYAIEYDYFPPTQIHHSLATKLHSNLFFAGQINGTTGYEEAACQGLMAGINASLNLEDREPLILRRSDAYIGVLIDDLVTKGTNEPYRMFTSRAEYRILLREDNADERLSTIGNKIGLISNENIEVLNKKLRTREVWTNYLYRTNIQPIKVNDMLLNHDSTPIEHPTKLSLLLTRPQINLEDLIDCCEELQRKDAHIRKADRATIHGIIETKIKYSAYISKQERAIERINKYENLIIKDDFDYMELKSLTIEAREKLSKIRPHTIAEAMHISGVSPADISVLVLYISK